MRSRSLVLVSRRFLVFILANYAIVVSPFVDSELRNYLVLFAALIGGTLFPMLRLTHHAQAVWALGLFLIMTISTLFLDGAEQLGSVALTLVYAMGYFSITSLLDRVDDKRALLMKVMRGIIFAFAGLSVVQMVTSLVGLPVPNLMATKGMLSYNSLAYEPSQLGRTVGISMLCYLMLSRLPGKQEPPRLRQGVLIAFLGTMLLSGSSMAVVAILAVYGLSRSNILVALIAVASITFLPIIMLLDYEPLTRFVLLTSSLPTMDVDQVLAADHSGGVRFAPLLIYLRDVSMAELGFWFGYGSEGLAYFFQGQIRGVANDNVGAAFLPGFAVVYGFLISTLFVWLFALRQANRTTLPLIAFWAIFMTSSAWNTQVFWYGLIVVRIARAASRDVFRSSTSAKP